MFQYEYPMKKMVHTLSDSSSEEIDHAASDMAILIT
jgi:hypothetical protein